MNEGIIYYALLYTLKWDVKYYYNLKKLCSIWIYLKIYYSSF